jgi:polysaccharide export outer membrane protein
MWEVDLFWLYKRRTQLLSFALCGVWFDAALTAQNSLPFPIGPATAQQQSGGSRACTPAEYGDLNADCIPVGANAGYNPYAALTDVSGDVPAAARYPAADPLDPTAKQPAQRAPFVQKEPPTEFQNYVARSVGRLLPIFGASLFENVPATFAPVEQIPVGLDYQIAPGDQLQVSVWGQVTISRRLSVNRAGDILLPEAGPLNVAGMNYSQATVVVKAALSRLYKDFQVNVSMTRLHSIQIFVVGEARRPGSYTVSSLSTLVNAIFASGGPASRGSMRRIELKRGTQTVRNFDLYDLLFQGDKSQDVQMLPGDVLFIPPAGPRVALAGSVGHAAIYELRKETSLGEALQLADGLSPLASRRQILLERIDSDTGNLQVRHASFRPEDLKVELQDGDIVRLMPLTMRFDNAITLRGNVAQPGRFPWRAGMRISDLIPNKESLLTKDYWNEKNALGAGEDLHLIEPEPGTNQPTNAEIRKADELPSGTFQDQKRNTQSDTSLGAATGLNNVPPIRTFNPRFTIQPAAPEINWDYAVIERTDPNLLSTTALPFNLGKVLLQHDGTQDLELQAGDVVTIFSKADFSVPRSQQVTQVRIEGEVAMAGIYSVRPGENLRQVVARAGGLTPNAYLYGAQFTRESTRREQQKRYDDFLNQLEKQINEAASNLSSRVTSPQQAATAQTSLAGQRDLVERLRRTTLNGRIVFDMDEQAQGLDALPDVPLEDGDRLYVPARPSTVNVIGDVFSQTSFLHRDDFRTGDYLRLAGGTERSADRSHMFLIRADGSIVSRHVTSPLFAKTFDQLRMSPGDTLVVPTYINKGTFVRGLIDWSQIFSNLALGAAAVNILH